MKDSTKDKIGGTAHQIKGAVKIAQTTSTTVQQPEGRSAEVVQKLVRDTGIRRVDP